MTTVDLDRRYRASFRLWIDLTGLVAQQVVNSPAAAAAQSSAREAELTYKSTRDALVEAHWVATHGKEPKSSPGSDSNPDPDEDQIRQLAHQLWESDGRPSGQAESHWRRAQALLQTGPVRTS
jgi:hypothetical protein